MTCGGNSLEDALKDTTLVMEVADNDLISLVSTQNHKNKEVMGW